MSKKMTKKEFEEKRTNLILAINERRTIGQTIEGERKLVLELSDKMLARFTVTELEFNGFNEQLKALEEEFAQPEEPPKDDGKNTETPKP